MLKWAKYKSAGPHPDFIKRTATASLTLWFIANAAMSSVSLESVLEEANSLYAQKKFAAARSQFEQAVEIDKGSISAWRGLAWSHWALGQKDRAYQIWSDLLKGFPDDSATLLAVARASEQDHRSNEAISTYQQLLKLHVHEREAHQGIGRILLAQKRYAAAEQQLKAALKLQPADSGTKILMADSLVEQAKYPEAEQLLKELTQTRPDRNNLRRFGKVLAESGKYEAAAEQYKASLRLQADDDTLAAWRGLGYTLRLAGQNQRAYKIWQDLIATYPQDVPTLLALARASQKDEVWPQSLDYYSKVLQKEPTNESAHLGRAKIFYGQLDYKQAEAELTALLSRAPDHNEAKLAMVDLLIATDRKSQAEQILRDMKDIDSYPGYLSRLGAVMVDSNREEEATAYFQKSLAADPDNLKTLQGLARSLWNQHRFQESTKLLQNYLTKHPDNDMVRARLAEHAAAAGDWRLAEQEFRNLVARHPEDNRWKIKLARHLDTQAKHKEAVQLAEQIVAKEPNNEMALMLLANSAIFSRDVGNGIRYLRRATLVNPSAERLNQLGKLHIELGDQLLLTGKPEHASVEYAAAERVFQQASAFDPIKTRSPIGLVEALRLQKKYPEAIQLAKQLHQEYPNSIDIIEQLITTYKDQGDYPEALKWLAKKQPLESGALNFAQNQAKLEFYAGAQKTGLQTLEKLQTELQQPVVQVLLYHGITVSERQDTVPIGRFREQLLALKKAGYHAISMEQLRGFLDGKITLPEKPLLITFDDARVDSFQNADPVLKELGFRATMFVPVGDVSTHGAYTVVWRTLREMAQTGRWDMQCHGTEAQHYIPVDAKGHAGRFLANKMWLTAANRLETTEEFTARVAQDLRNCKHAIQRELPNANIMAFAFPYSDQGHRSLSNAPEIFKINEQVVKDQFQLGFHVENNYPITQATSRFALPRFEVSRNSSGAELVQKLRDINPEVSLPYDQAKLEMDAGHYAKAKQIFAKLEQDGVIDKGQLLAITGKAANRSGDHAEARNRLQQAQALRPDDGSVAHEIALLDRRLKPVAQLSGLYFEDNAKRSYYSFGPAMQFPVSDRLTFGAYYKYLDFNQKLASRALGEQQFQANGHQFEGQMSYELGARSALSLSAGAADFSGSIVPGSGKSDVTFPIGSIKLKVGVGDNLDLALGADHTYVNTAGAILHDLAFSRVQGGVKYKLLDVLNLSLNHGYSYYTDHNQRHTTQVDLSSPVWNDPDITLGLQFVHDDMHKHNPLFWTPNNYLAFAAPFSLKKSWGPELVTEIYVAPGMGKETGRDFRFQLNATGVVTWNLNDDISLYLSGGRYEAATYSNFSAFAGGSMRF